MESLEHIKKELEVLKAIRQTRAKANLKYYHKRMAEDENYKTHLRQKALERYYKKKAQKEQQQSQQ